MSTHQKNGGKNSALEIFCVALEKKLQEETSSRMQLQKYYESFYGEFLESSTRTLQNIGELQGVLSAQHEAPEITLPSSPTEVPREVQVPLISQPPSLDCPLTVSFTSPLISSQIESSRNVVLDLEQTATLPNQSLRMGKKIQFTGKSVGMENELRKIMMVSGSSGCGTPLPSRIPSTNASGVSSIPAIALLGSPFLGLMSATPPKFSGKAEDWFTFVQEWERQKNLMSMVLGGNEIPDNALLEALNKSLDNISQKLLQQKREEDPSISFKEFCHFAR